MGADTPFSDFLTKLEADLGPRVTAMLDELAGEAEANLHQAVAQGGAHDPGTKTPASPGRGPARVTGQLAGAVVRKRARKTSKASWRASVGIAATPRAGSRYTNALVARWVERGHAKGHRGTGRIRQSAKAAGNVPGYPFMAPSLKAVGARAQAALIKHLTRWP